ncbi:YetF domain-containing protein [Planococcus faecalis]
MKKERIKEMEILQAIRNTGFGSTEKVKAVVLETDGSLSVISSETGNALENVNSES